MHFCCIFCLLYQEFVRQKQSLWSSSVTIREQSSAACFEAKRNEYHLFYSYFVAMPEAGCPPRVQSAKKRPCRPRNPFAYRERDNFPGLDFGMTDAKQEAEANYSMTSEGSSFLNMSIGVRAALNEHMRNVTKYGIDGERPVSDDKGAQTPRNALDAQWENLLDGNTPRVDLSGSFAAVPSSPRLDVMLSNQDGSECLEGTMDLSQDFFNSSRVLMLATPEKNRKQAKDFQQEETYQGDDSEVSSYANMAPELKGSLGISQHSTGRNSSFVSFSVAEMSQISNDGSEIRRLPDESFHGRWTIEENAFSPIKEMGTPLRFQDASFAQSNQPRFMRNSSTSSISSTPWRTPPRNTSTPTLPRTNSTPGLPVLLDSPIPSESNFKQRSTRPDSNSSHKENHLKNMTPTFGYSPAVSPFVASSGMSPAAALAGVQASQMLKGYSCYGAACLAEENAFDRMPTDFLNAIKSSKDAALSPISQTNLSVVDITSNVGSGIGDSWEGSFPSIRSAKRIKAESPSPSASLTAQYSRRQFHTVVPAPRFRDSPSEFPEECDIFTAPAPRLNRSGNDHTRKSLINSFEEAYFP
jgi:hypothetical protein